jgi:uncharacterized repeat protein (TIGR02543 family)
VFCTGPEETVHLPEGGTETINVGCFIQEAPGIVSSSPGGISNCGVLGGHCSSHFTPGTEVTLSESPVEYGISGETSKFEGWGGACSGTEPICKVTMSEDKTVTAKFGF